MPPPAAKATVNQFHERSHDRPGFHRPRPQRTVDRPDYCRQDRGRFAFPSLQIGVAQESFGESMQRNMSWAGYDGLAARNDSPPLFDRCSARAKKAG